MAVSSSTHSDFLTSSATLAASAAGFSNKALDLMQRRGVSDEDIETFEQILAKTADTADAKQALSELSKAEMEVLRKVHSLADTIQVGELTDEGAANLLVQPGSEHDLNNDGLTTTGIANAFTFPPENAPESFKKAWDEATAGKDFGEIPTHMIFAVGLANLEREPGDPDWVNPYADPDYDYQGRVEQIIDALQYQYDVSLISFESYQRNTQFYNKLKGAMSA